MAGRGASFIVNMPLRRVITAGRAGRVGVIRDDRDMFPWTRAPRLINPDLVGGVGRGRGEDTVLLYSSRSCRPHTSSISNTTQETKVREGTFCKEDTQDGGS